MASSPRETGDRGVKRQKAAERDLVRHTFPRSRSSDISNPTFKKKKRGKGRIVVIYE